MRARWVRLTGRAACRHFGHVWRVYAWRGDFGDATPNYSGEYADATLRCKRCSKEVHVREEPYS